VPRDNACFLDIFAVVDVHTKISITFDKFVDECNVQTWNVDPR
jgi:hypothetical protein